MRSEAFGHVIRRRAGKHNLKVDSKENIQASILFFLPHHLFFFEDERSFVHFSESETDFYEVCIFWKRYITTLSGRQKVSSFPTELKKPVVTLLNQENTHIWTYKPGKTQSMSAEKPHKTLKLLFFLDLCFSFWIKTLIYFKKRNSPTSLRCIISG